LLLDQQIAMQADRPIRQSGHARIGVILFDEGTTHWIGGLSGSMMGFDCSCRKASPIGDAQDSAFAAIDRPGQRRRG
jgi:hypothetical protein